MYIFKLKMERKLFQLLFYRAYDLVPWVKKFFVPDHFATTEYFKYSCSEKFVMHRNICPRIGIPINIPRRTKSI